MYDSEQVTYYYSLLQCPIRPHWNVIHARVRHHIYHSTIHHVICFDMSRNTFVVWGKIMWWRDIPLHWKYIKVKITNYVFVVITCWLNTINYLIFQTGLNWNKSFLSICVQVTLYVTTLLLVFSSKVFNLTTRNLWAIFYVQILGPHDIS